MHVTCVGEVTAGDIPVAAFPETLAPNLFCSHFVRASSADVKTEVHEAVWSSGGLARYPESCIRFRMLAGFTRVSRNVGRSQELPRELAE
jgi:hypothetical protein